MIWQDAVLASAQVMFLLALIPSMIGLSDRPPAIMCWVTGLNLSACAAAQFSLSLIGAAICTEVLALCWLAMAWQGSLHGARSALVFEWRGMTARWREWRK